MSEAPRASARMRLARLALLAAPALAAFICIQLLPTGSRLGHMDFRPRGGPLIQCDPAAPQFVPVSEVPSPVTLSLGSSQAAAGRRLSLRAQLRSASGRPVGPAELLEYHTRLLHLLVIGPGLGDYQHLHPEPAPEDGAWDFSFTPRGPGIYRIFADFMPRATGRPLYAVADLKVGSGMGDTPASPLDASELAPLSVPLPPPAGADGLPTAADTGHPTAPSAVLHAELICVTPPESGRSFTLELRLHRADGSPCPLEPVMGAYAHLVAFDAARSGFAHLHPDGGNPLDASVLPPRPSPDAPTLRFKALFPRPGTYVLWAQLRLGGRDLFLPFRLTLKEKQQTTP